MQLSGPRDWRTCRTERADGCRISGPRVVTERQVQSRKVRLEPRESNAISSFHCRQAMNSEVAQPKVRAPPIAGTFRREDGDYGKSETSRKR